MFTVARSEKFVCRRSHWPRPAQSAPSRSAGVIMALLRLRNYALRLAQESEARRKRAWILVFAGPRGKQEGNLHPNGIVVPMGFGYCSNERGLRPSSLRMIDIG